MKRIMLLTAMFGSGVAFAEEHQHFEGQVRKPIYSITSDDYVPATISIANDAGQLLIELNDANEKVRKQAAKRLGRLDLHCHPEIEPALARALTTDCSKGVRFAAVCSLVKLGAALPCTHSAYSSALEDECIIVRAYAKSALNHTPGFGPYPGPGMYGTGFRGHSTRLQPFELGDVRYEPTVRDTRFVPHIRTLPGNDSGIRETLPVLPPRRHGFFMLPTY